MRSRTLLPALFLSVALLAVVSCGSDGEDDDAPTTTILTSGTTVIDGSLPDTTSTTSESSTTTDSIPPVTPPPGQPAACTLLSRDALQAVGVPADDVGNANSDPEGPPAPSNSCDWLDGEMGVALYYGRDPIEILAAARQQFPGGEDVPGLGSEAYYLPVSASPNPESGATVVFVDTGAQAFVVGGPFTRDQVLMLAEEVISNL